MRSEILMKNMQESKLNSLRQVKLMKEKYHSTKPFLSLSWIPNSFKCLNLSAPTMQRARSGPFHYSALITISKWTSPSLNYCREVPLIQTLKKAKWASLQTHHSLRCGKLGVRCPWGGSRWQISPQWVSDRILRRWICWLHRHQPMHRYCKIRHLPAATRQGRAGTRRWTEMLPIMRLSLRCANLSTKQRRLRHLIYQGHKKASSEVATKIRSSIKLMHLRLTSLIKQQRLITVLSLSLCKQSVSQTSPSILTIRHLPSNPQHLRRS